MEASAFIFAVKKIGVYDHNTSSVRRLSCRRYYRSVTVSRHTSTTFRRLAVLEERVSDTDLEIVPGLSNLVKDQEWARYRSLRVSELLHNMLSLCINA